MLWSEHVYCVAIAFKMTEQVEQQICIKFCVKLEHSSMEAIWMIQKAAAMGTWWLAASSQQHVAYVSHLVQSFWQTSIHPGDSGPYRPDLAPCNFCLCPKLKSPLKGKIFQMVDEIQENMMGQLMAVGPMWDPKVPILKGTGASLSYVCTMFLVSCIFLSKCIYFSYHMAVYHLYRLCI